jgi:hypothetical protein
MIENNQKYEIHYYRNPIDEGDYHELIGLLYSPKSIVYTHQYFIEAIDSNSILAAKLAVV